MNAKIAEDYGALRPLLFSIAYRMLGSVAEADDVVQDTFLRYQRALADQAEEIVSPRAYLSTVATRLAIDRLRSARARKESYVGPWLPEPLPTDDPAVDGPRAVEDAESISLAFLLLLERLSPAERAVFLLHDVFDYGYDEIAGILDRTEAGCRQLAVRARQHVEDGRPRFEPSRRRREDLADRFFAAVGDGDVDALVDLLAADAVVVGDGGGRGPSWLRPIEGRDRVVRLLAGVGGQLRALGLSIRRRELNGQPGAFFLDRDGRLVNVMTLDVRDGRVSTVRSVINPDKLAHLGPLADVRALARERRPRPD